MKSIAKAALCGACLMSPVAAAADDCTGTAAQTHTVQVLFQGFFPSVIYVCSGDTIRFENNSGRWAGFNISDGSDSGTGHDFSYYWTQNGTSRDYVVNDNSGTNFINFDLWGSTPGYDGEGRLVFGKAPNS